MKIGDRVIVRDHLIEDQSKSRVGDEGEITHVTIDGRYTTVRLDDGQEFYFSAICLELVAKLEVTEEQDCGEVYAIHRYADARVVVRVRAA